MENIYRICLLGWIGLISMPAQAISTATSSFHVDWSGALFGNQAEAHGLLTLYAGEGSKFTNSAQDAWLNPDTDIVDFSITVSGARSGNGTFGLSDFAFFIWDTDVTSEWPLDLSRELVGQTTTGGSWGSDASSNVTTGDFTFVSNFDLNPFAPTSDGGAFLIATNGGPLNGDTYDVMGLTSFRPVPLPAAFWLFGPALLGLFRIGFQRHAHAV